jgi:hypothetical protein
MKFPITRESLQAFDYEKEKEELRKEEIQVTLALILEGLCKEFKEGMSSNSREKRFVWRKLHIINITNYSSNKDYIPIFIDKVKETFIGCDIIIDPLKTYLIIDWS